jgi:hypothetical protein
MFHSLYHVFSAAVQFGVQQGSKRVIRSRMLRRHAITSSFFMSTRRLIPTDFSPCAFSIICTITASLVDYGLGHGCFFFHSCKKQRKAHFRISQ